MNLADKILSFLQSLDLQVKLPADVEVMNPFKEKATFDLCKKFYKKFYSDNNKRRMIIGINPGRFGAGVTGIPFTDPIRLEKECGIKNSFAKKIELSSIFIYDMINAYGGAELFYKNFYFSAVSPLGFTKNNKNMNYYDDKNLEQSIKDFVIDCNQKQLSFGMQSDVGFCLGEDKNYKYISKLNNELNFLITIIPLPHPRFIMQYKLKKKDEFIDRYLRELYCITLHEFNFNILLRCILRLVLWL